MLSNERKMKENQFLLGLVTENKDVSLANNLSFEYSKLYGIS